MKKLVTLLLSLALVLSLAACGGEATPDASDDAPASSQNEESHRKRQHRKSNRI